MSLFAQIFNGRRLPLSAARSGAVAGDQLPAGDCFPHVLSFDPVHAEVIATRRWPWSAGKDARVTRLRGARVREGACATRFPADDVQ